MIKQELTQKLTQKLSPLQIQTIKLIELPVQELEQSIRKELEENPVLDDNAPESKDDDRDEQPREVSLSEIKDDDSIPEYRLHINNYGKDEKPQYNTFSVKESKPMQVFCTALMLQLILNPTALESVGFQLSYLAMAGIILLYPKLKSWYPEDEVSDVHSKTKFADKLNFPRRIWDASALTVSCQIFTGPLAWLTFGTFPKYFLLTNILALPVTSILMTLAFIAVMLHIAGICPQIILSATDYAASALIFIMQTISTM